MSVRATLLVPSTLVLYCTALIEQSQYSDRDQDRGLGDFLESVNLGLAGVASNINIVTCSIFGRSHGIPIRMPPDLQKKLQALVCDSGPFCTQQPQGQY